MQHGSHRGARAGNPPGDRARRRALAQGAGQGQPVLDTEPAAVRWQWWDRFVFGLLALLVVVLLGAEWCNASTLLKSSGVEDFVRSDLRAFGATIAAVLLALLLKTAASAIPRRSVRYALAFTPALVSLSAWVVLMSIAFPGYALSPMALLNLGSESMGPPVGLPAGHAWLLPASACFGIAWGAAAVTVYIDDFYHDRTAAKREINPQYARTEAALQGVLKALAVQAEQLGRGQGMLKRVYAARQITGDQAVALYLSLRTSPPAPRSTGLGFHRPRLSKPSQF